MPAQEIKIQPRQKPLKPEDVRNQKALIEHQAAVQASQQPAAPPLDIVPGTSFDLPGQAAPSQADLVAKALQGLPSVEQSLNHLDGQQVAVVTQTQSSPDLNEGVVLVPSQPPTPKPPSTIAEYKAQHARANTRYPDVGEIFAGRVPNEPVISPPVHMPQPKVAPAPPVEIIIKHELPTKTMAYVALKTFDAYVGAGFCHFEKGQIITDIYTVDQLLAGDCLFIAPYEDASNFIQCPHCANHFPDPRGVVKYG